MTTWLVPPSSSWRGTLGQSYTPQTFKDYVAGITFQGGFRPQFIVLHNTGAPTLVQWKSSPVIGRLKNLTNYYNNQLGWMGGPHLFVDDKNIWTFTPLYSRGTHSPSWNGISWGLEMSGNFDTEEFDPAVRDNAVAAIAILSMARGLNPDSMKLHREDRLTTHACPGRHVDKADVIKRVHLYITNSNPGDHPLGAITS